MNITESVDLTCKIYRGLIFKRRQGGGGYYFLLPLESQTNCVSSLRGIMLNFIE